MRNVIFLSTWSIFAALKRLHSTAEVKMFGAGRIRKQEPSPYANAKDFCRIFHKDMNRLYLLSSLLTADEAMAEQCFVGGLHLAQSGSLVFKEWAESWARRTIILNAIRLVRPRLGSEGMAGSSRRSTGDAVIAPSEITGILELPVFERFAFVMSVLEGHSDQECALHLSCTRGDIIAARTRTLERLGRSTQRREKLVTIASGRKASQENSGSGLELETASGLAASA
jgi:DNA-directed RNA polymerase specialized sigma24 family protein